ncbi:MAG: ferredoxin reductase family protein [Acidimicrobiales bacterium]
MLLVGGFGMGLVLGLPLVDGTLSEVHLRGGVAMFFGSTTGLAGTYLALVMVVLASRAPALERMLGQDGVLRWHRRLAPWPILLISMHAVLLTFAYAQAAKSGLLSEFGSILNSFPDMISATVALGIMLFIGIISIRQIRTRLPRERWWLMHLLMYAALILSFAHEVALGPSFVRHPIARDSWIAAWIVGALLILVYRVGVPVYRSVRHKLRVVEVRPEGPGVVSVILEGKELERLVISGGQFFEWRFLTKGMWWQAHPFTVSSLPQPPYLRLTIKGAGDYSRAIASVRRGTKVALEGPYGAFTVHAQRRRQVLLIAGGVGVTAVRALLEELPPRSRPVVVLRASSEEELLLAGEVDELVRHRKGVTHHLIGSRDAVPMDMIARRVPDIAKRDVYVSGSESFVRDVVAMATRAGVAKEALHQEAYSF